MSECSCVTCSLVDPDTGCTALHVAVLANDEKQVTQLLELGAQSSVGDQTGVTPVMSAAEHGHIEVLQTLALKGINAGGGPIAVESWERERSRCHRILLLWYTVPTYHIIISSCDLHMCYIHIYAQMRAYLH